MVDLQELYDQAANLLREQFTDSERAALATHLAGVDPVTARNLVRTFVEDIAP